MTDALYPYGKHLPIFHTPDGPMSQDAAALRGNWNYPTSVKFGVGRIKELPDHCKALGLKRPLLVTDPGLAGLPMIKDAIAANAAAGILTGLFSEVQGNPVGKNVEDGLKVYRDGKHDGVIAFGGGYHGRTMMTLGMTGKVAPYKLGFGPFPGSVFHALFPNALHGVSIDAALASVASYLLVLWAFQNGPIAPVAALRDTSAIFAALISVVVLKEPLSRRVLVAVALAAAGAALFRLGWPAGR